MILKQNKSMAFYNTVTWYGSLKTLYDIAFPRISWLSPLSSYHTNHNVSEKNTTVWGQMRSKKQKNVQSRVSETNIIYCFLLVQSKEVMYLFYFANEKYYCIFKMSPVPIHIIYFILQTFNASNWSCNALIAK